MWPIRTRSRFHARGFGYETHRNSLPLDRVEKFGLSTANERCYDPPLNNLSWRQFMNCLIHTRMSIIAFSLAVISTTLCCPEMSPAAEAPRPLAPPTALSLREARVIIDGAVAYAREKKLRMTVVILDEEGQLISADRMEGASFHLERFAKGKAFT